MGGVVLRSSWNKWRENRRRFPTRWLTYKRRVRDDVELLYKTEKGKEFFGDKYVEALKASAKQLEEWEIKLFVLQVGIYIFVVIGLFVSDTSFSLFGISLKQSPGVKEILLAFSASLAVIIYSITQSKQLRLTVIEKITELKEDPALLAFAKLAGPAPFHLNVYIARQFDRWILSTFLTKTIFILLSLLSVLFVLSLVAISFSIWIYLLIDIMRKPTLGLWSYIALIHSAIAVFLCVMWFIRAYLPLPFRDMEVLQELRRLEKSDPAEYAKRLQEIYGPLSP